MKCAFGSRVVRRLVWALAATLGLALAASAASMADQKEDFSTRLKGGQPQRIVAYGTSLTAEGSSFWVKQLGDLLKARYPGLVTMINSGQGAMWSTWGVDNLTSRVIQKKPDVVFIEFGINDDYMDNRLSLADTHKNVVNMVTRIRASNPNCEIVLMSMNYPIREHLERRPNVLAQYQVYHDVAQELGTDFIDLVPTWKAIFDTNPRRYDYLVPDGIHPNAIGNLAVTVPGICNAFADLKPLVAGLTPDPKWAASPSVKISFAGAGDSQGLTRVVVGSDGTAPETALGESGARVSKTKLYLDVDNGWLDAVTDVKFTIRYLDDTAGGTLRIDYDSNDATAAGSGSAKIAGTIKLTGTGAWTTATLTLKGCIFSGRQASGADLNITSKGVEPLIAWVQLDKIPVTQ